MTGENMKLESLTKKLQNICDENGLAYRFRRHEYPISLTILPLGGVSEQLSMLEMADEKGYISPDARIVFEYKDGTLVYHMSESFTISDALFAKVKNLFKNMLFLWLLHFNREVIIQQLLTATQQKIIVGGSEDDDYDEDRNGSGDDLTVDNELPEFTDDEENEEETSGNETEDKEAPSEQDPIVQQAIEVVREVGSATVSFLQRRLSIGYSRASRLMDTLEQLGVVGPFNGSSPREVLPVWQDEANTGEGDAE